MNTAVTPQPEIVQAQAIRIADQAYESAESVEIDSPEMFQVAGAELQAIKTRYKQIEEMRLGITRPMDAAKQKVMDLFRQPLERLAAAEKMVGGAMLTYQRAEQEKREQARRAAEEADRIERARLDKIRRDAEAEQKRIQDEAAEAQRIADAAAADARKAGDEEAARAAEASAAEQQRIADEAAAQAGETAEAAAAEIELAEVAPLALPAVAAPKASGISTRHNWKAEVVDFPALVAAAARRAADGDPTLLGYLLPNEKALGAMAKALKTQARIPGVRIYAEDGLSVRTR